jgi:hypothetical protein
LAKIVDAESQQGDASSSARSRASRFASGMTAANDHYVKHSPANTRAAPSIQRGRFT